MDTETLYVIAGISAVIVGVCMVLAGWVRRGMSTPAARALSLGMGLWFLRYGVRLTDQSDAHITPLGNALSDPRTLAATTALLALSAVLYVTERAP